MRALRIMMRALRKTGPGNYASAAFSRQRKGTHAAREGRMRMRVQSLRSRVQCHRLAEGTLRWSQRKMHAGLCNQPERQVHLPHWMVITWPRHHRESETLSLNRWTRVLADFSHRKKNKKKRKHAKREALGSTYLPGIPDVHMLLSLVWFLDQRQLLRLTTL